jgi:hypothetical protein
MSEMCITIYRLTPGAAGSFIRRANVELFSMLLRQPGFRSYQMVNTGDTSAVGLSRWERANQAARAAIVTAVWVNAVVASEVLALEHHIGDLASQSNPDDGTDSGADLRSSGLTELPEEIQRGWPAAFGRVARSPKTTEMLLALLLGGALFTVRQGLDPGVTVRQAALVQAPAGKPDSAIGEPNESFPAVAATFPDQVLWLYLIDGDEQAERAQALIDEKNAKGATLGEPSIAATIVRATDSAALTESRTTYNRFAAASNLTIVEIDLRSNPSGE